MHFYVLRFTNPPAPISGTRFRRKKKAIKESKREKDKGILILNNNIGFPDITLRLKNTAPHLTVLLVYFRPPTTLY